MFGFYTLKFQILDFTFEIWGVWILHSQILKIYSVKSKYS